MGSASAFEGLDRAADEDSSVARSLRVPNQDGRRPGRRLAGTPGRVMMAMSSARLTGLYLRVAKGARLVAACEQSASMPVGAACEQSASTPVGALRAAAEPSMIIVVIGGPIAGTDVCGLCERVRVVLEGSDADVVVCDVSALVDPDVGMADALARLALTARRLGRQVRLRHASRDLQELLAFIGLGDVLPVCAESAPGSRGQAEQRKQPRRVEERGDPDDPAG
jgi:ABC-type transporter Mla MlaB component